MDARAPRCPEQPGRVLGPVPLIVADSIVNCNKNLHKGKAIFVSIGTPWQQKGRAARIPP